MGISTIFCRPPPLLSFSLVMIHSDGADAERRASRVSLLQGKGGTLTQSLPTMHSTVVASLVPYADVMTTILSQQSCLLSLAGVRDGQVSSRSRPRQALERQRDQAHSVEFENRMAFAE